jgi:hypothetical protein
MLELNEIEIMEALKKYLKENGVEFWRGGKEITLKSFEVEIVDTYLPRQEPQYGDISIEGKCKFEEKIEDGGSAIKRCKFSCGANVTRVNDEVTVNSIKDNRIYLGQPL